jgi:hypothetical protein
MLTRVHCYYVPEVKTRQVPYTTCHIVTRQHCQMIPQRRCYYVPETKCVQVPYTTCRLVPEERCMTVCVRKCRWVTEQRTCKVPYVTCRLITEERCQQVPEVTCSMEPYRARVQVCRPVPVSVPVYEPAGVPLSSAEWYARTINQFQCCH